MYYLLSFYLIFSLFKKFLIKSLFLKMSFEALKEEVKLVMTRKEHWVTLWTHSKTGLSKYPGYNPNAFNAITVGMSALVNVKVESCLGSQPI